MKSNPLLMVTEIIVLGGILAAFILPAFSPSSEEPKPVSSEFPITLLG